MGPVLTIEDVDSYGDYKLAIERVAFATIGLTLTRVDAIIVVHIRDDLWNQVVTMSTRL